MQWTEEQIQELIGPTGLSYHEYQKLMLGESIKIGSQEPEIAKEWLVTILEGVYEALILHSEA